MPPLNLNFYQLSLPLGHRYRQRLDDDDRRQDVEGQHRVDHPLQRHLQRRREFNFNVIENLFRTMNSAT